MAGDIRISVVVAVYNPGPNIDGLISSLDAQSLSRDEFEVVFVDDGSTDGTPQRLHEVARTRPNVTVTTIPNSGWPGRPRNVGTDLARGKYVFYADHDDEFFPRSLQAMLTMAEANASDVVFGKVVRVGGNTPYWELSKADKGHADLVDDHLMVSRSTHKLYRREFLVDHGIRFLEGRVRLEDHHFMGQVLARRPEVAIIASEPCYRWIHRNNGSNSSSQAVDLDVYFGYFTASVQLLQTDVVADRVREEIAVVSAVRMFLAVRPRHWFTRDLETRQANALTLRSFLETCVPARLDHRLPLLKERAVAALREGDLDAFEAVQTVQASLRHSVAVDGIRWDGERLVVDLDATLTDAEGKPVRMVPMSDDIAFPAELGALRNAGAPPRLLSRVERGAAEVTLRHRQSWVEWPVHSVTQANTARAIDDGTLAVHVSGTIDPAQGFFGRPLETGIWDVLARVQFLGEQQVRRVPVGAATSLPHSPHLVGGAEVTAYRTKLGNLSLRISAAGSPPSVAVLTAGWDSGRLVVTIDPPVTTPGAQLVARLRATGKEQLAAMEGGPVRLMLGPSVIGDIFDFWLRTPDGPDAYRDQRLMFGAAQVSQRLPYQIYDTVHGSFSVKRVQAVQPARSSRPLARRARSFLSRLR